MNKVNNLQEELRRQYELLYEQDDLLKTLFKIVLDPKKSSSSSDDTSTSELNFDTDFKYDGEFKNRLYNGKGKLYYKDNILIASCIIFKYNFYFK